MSQKQQHVLKNLEGVTHDGSRVERRFELAGENVSISVRALIDKGLVVMNEAGTLTRAVHTQRVEPEMKRDALRDIRAALEGEPEPFTIRRYPMERRRRRMLG